MMMSLFGAIEGGHMHITPAIKIQGKEGEEEAARIPGKHPLTCPEFITLFCFV